jgi:regulatory protein
MSNSALDKAKSYAYRLLNFRPRSEQELREKLRNRGYSKDIISHIVSDLKSRALIDDYVFAQLWTKSRLQDSGHSLFRIRQELIAKGITREIIEDILAQGGQDFDELDIAVKLISKRVTLVRNIEKDKAMQRLYSYLKRRGFSSNIIYKAINEAYANTQ